MIPEINKDEPILSLEVLEEINNNPAFLHILVTTAMDDGVVSAFNKLANTNINFKALAPNGINALIDKATGFNGIIANNEEFGKFVFMVYRFIYLPSLNDFLEYEAQGAK